MTRGVKTGLPCRYEYDLWAGDDGHLYVKVTAIEFERATADSFALNARRRARMWLGARDIPMADIAPSRINWLGVWDIARDWASDLPEAYTYRTTYPLPADYRRIEETVEDEEHSDAA